MKAYHFGSVAYEALLDAAGTASLGPVLFDIAHGQADVEELFGFWFEAGQAPVPLVSAGCTGSSTKRASLYAAVYHALDPLAPAFERVCDGAPTAIHHVTANMIVDLSYRRECFERPQLGEKTSFVRRRGTRSYVLSFYRRDAENKPAVGLVQLADMVLPILRKHEQISHGETERPLLDRLIDRIRRAYPDLTVRERDVCARTIGGMTAEAIGLDLDIAPSTVLTYRRRAYERYGISNANQLVARLLD